LVAALAARQTPLDRAALLRSLREPVPVAARTSSGSLEPVRHVSLDERWQAASGDLTEARSGNSDAGATARSGQTVPVPDVRALPPRVAVRRLHALGLRVTWDRDGPIVGTNPGSGARLMPGDTVHLRVGGSRR
jgi:hypothetical protein